MKTIYKLGIIICLSVFANEMYGSAPIVLSPTQAKPHIITVTPTTPLSSWNRNFVDPNEATYRIDYFDGLGRPQETMHLYASPQRNTIVTVNEYDDIGRSSKKWLPGIITNNSGEFLNPAEVKSRIIEYHTDTHPYSFPCYEISPLSRVIKQTRPGSDWHEQGVGVVSAYLTNSSIENPHLVCAQYEVVEHNIMTGRAKLTKKKDYDPNLLFATSVMDDDSYISYTFQDKTGNTLLYRQINGDEILDTYYVYDDFGNLRFVLPPMASSQLTAIGQNWTDTFPILKDYVYCYNYDIQNRLVSKRIPGCGWEYMVYDKADRLIMSQDSIMSENSKWNYIVYDNLGRIESQWIVNDGRSRADLQNETNLYPKVDPAPDPDPDSDPILVEVDRSCFLVYDKTANDIPVGAMYNYFIKRGLYPYGYIDEDDNIHPDFYIGSDPSNPNIEYYYILRVVISGDIKFFGLLFDYAIDYYQKYCGLSAKPAKFSLIKNFPFDVPMEYEISARIDISYPTHIPILPENPYTDPNPNVEECAVAYIDRQFALAYDKSKNDIPPGAIYNIMMENILGYPHGYLDENDYIHPDFFIYSDPDNPNIEYYYILNLPYANPSFDIWSLKEALFYCEMEFEIDRDNSKFKITYLPPGRHPYDIYTRINLPYPSIRSNSTPVMAAAMIALSNMMPTAGSATFTLPNGSVPLSENRYGGYLYPTGVGGEDLVFTVPSYLGFEAVDGIVAASSIITRTTNLLVYNKTYIIDGDDITDDFVERAYYYDYKGRVIQIVERNHLGGISRYSTKYDFVGNVLASLEQHGDFIEDPIVEIIITNRTIVTEGFVETGEYETLTKEYFVISSPENPSYPRRINDPENRYFISKLKIHDRYLFDCEMGGDFYYIPEDCVEIAYGAIQSSGTKAGFSIWEGEFPGTGEPLTELLYMEYGLIFETVYDTTYVYSYFIERDRKLSEFEYDHRGRLLSEKTTLNGGKPAIVEHVYDELGRLMAKKYDQKTTLVTVNPDFILHLYATHTIPSDEVNSLFSEILSRDYGIDNWDDYDYFKDGKINEAYRVKNMDLFTWPYYFPLFEKPIPVSKVITEIESRLNIWQVGIGIYTEKRPNEKFPRDLTFELTTPGFTETYDYNIQGWLTEKSSDVFDMRLRYHDPQQPDTAPSYTGNITEWEWQHKGSGSDNTPNSYAFTYDQLSRLTDSQLFQHSNDQWQRSGSFEEWLGAGDVDAYDKNGNILSLMRSSATGSIMDGFRYEYNGNQLAKLYLDWDNDSDFVTYAYDANGNCTVDGLNALKLEYNFLNLVGEVKSSFDNSTLANYTWLADGTKVGVKDANGAGFEYLGSLIYTRDGNDLNLESASFGGGRFKVSETDNGRTYMPNYFLTDHLGSTRAVVGSDGNVSERNDYLPFGGRWEVSGAAISNNRFRFSGKEDQSSLGLPYSDFGARMLDKRTGRWISMDPAEQYHSGYVYCGNNPVRHVDPTGMWSITLTGQAAQEAFMLFKSMYDDDPEKRKKEEEERGQREMTQETRDRLDGMFDNAYNNAGWSLLGFLHTAGKTLLDFLNPVGGIKSAGDKLDAEEDLTLEDGIDVGLDIAGIASLGALGFITKGTKVSSKVARVQRAVKTWIGEEATIIINKSDDLIIISKDGTKKMRFDLKNVNHSSGRPHIHLEEFKNGKWQDILDHRIYPKE